MFFFNKLTEYLRSAKTASSLRLVLKTLVTLICTSQCSDDKCTTQRILHAVITCAPFIRGFGHHTFIRSHFPDDF